MNVTFFIGNGFDLNCGLKSGYNDVCKAFLESKASDISGEQELRECLSKRISLWGDFEMSIPEFAKEMSDVKSLVDGKRSFEAFLRAYLYEEQTKFWDRFNNVGIKGNILVDVKREMYNSFVNFYRDISPNVDYYIENIGHLSFSVISLNYTNIFPKLCEGGFVDGSLQISVNSVHGTLSSGIVFGINDESQISSEYLVNDRVKRSLIKPVLNVNFDKRRVDKAIEALMRSNAICVFGASLGESDLLWRNIIIEWLLENSNHHLFFYDYRFHSRFNGSIDEKLDIEEDAKIELFSKWRISDDNSQRIFDQVHIPIGKNIFIIDQVLNNSIEREKRRSVSKPVGAI